MPDRTIAPPVRPFEGLSIPDETTEILPNGVTLHTYDGGDQDVSRLSLLFAGGQAEASDTLLPGITFDLMRFGSKCHSGDEISEALDYNGATLRTRSLEHHTGYELIAMNKHLGQILPLMLEILSAPTLPAELLQVFLRKAAANEAVKQSKVAYLSQQEVTRMMRGNEHPLARQSTPEAIAAITIDDVRAAHTSTVAGTTGTHAFVSGHINDKTLSSYKNLLSQLPKGRPAKLHITPFTATEPSTSHILRPQSLQASVSAAIPAVPRSHPDYIPLRLTVMALGGYFGSRLMTNIREKKGLTYGISASLLGTAEGAYTQIDAQCANETCAIVVEEIINELHRLVTAPPTGDELRHLKLYASTMLAATLDSPFSIIDYHQSRLTVGTPDNYFALQLQAINTLTPDTIASMASQYLAPTGIRLAIAGNDSSRPTT